jgi:HAD superfamily hydrolase (TIGR01490 family)
MVKTKPVAFFDIDGTLFRSSLLIELMNQLIDRGVFPVEAEEAYRKEKTAWLNRQGSYEAYIGAVVVSFVRHIKGVHYGVLVDVGREIADSTGKRVYRYTRDLLLSLKKDGYYLVAISQSPKVVLDHFTKQYGFDKVYGSLYEIGPQDLFTGAVMESHQWLNKANIVRRVIEKEELDLAGSVGVGDTESDIPLLEAVGDPICFNPNMALYKHARLMGWKVVVERKDVVYTIPT